MKKIAAFLTALALFLACIMGFHISMSGKLETNNPEFGTWVNKHKDLSYFALEQNLHEDTMLVLGSSEFQRGEKTDFHPSKVFNKEGVNLMCVGAAYNQSLSHAITVAALAPSLKSKKVVLLASPSWFIPSWLQRKTFPTRFSESQYVKMLQNKNLSTKTKQAIADQCGNYLFEDEEMKKQVEKYNRAYLENPGSLIDTVTSGIRMSFIQSKEAATVGTEWEKSGKETYEEYNPRPVDDGKIDWKTLHQRAEEKVKYQKENHFYMKNKLYIDKIKPKLHKRKNSALKKSYESSFEYGDLKLFLDVCKEENLDVMVVLLPVNGFWYDYTGFPKAKRAKFVPNIMKVAKDYDVRINNMYKDSYTPGVFIDAVHPSEKGWLMIDEEIYNFYWTGKTNIQ